MKILVADLLCGAGGSSTGCARAMEAMGLSMDLVCVNHWPVAIDTHTRNHPAARHYVQDIASVRPAEIVPEGRLDLLMASPTCTHHSVARGGKPTSDQQRSDPWHIITWLTELRVRRIIIENVWEFTGWGPVDPRTGRPVKSRKGEYFFAWIETLRRLGFDPQWRKLNAADYGDATTRERFILMARSDGKKVRWPSPTHAARATCYASLLPGLKPWKPAREIIDWTIKGKSIFTRKKPLAPKTLARIHAGLVKFGWPQPFLVILRNHMAAQGMDVPLPTITATGSHIGLVQPQPFIINGRKGNKAQGVDTAPIPTLDTKGGVWLTTPFVTSYYGSGEGCNDSGDPLPTVTTKDRFGLVVPITHAGGESRVLNAITDPLPTVTGANRGELALVHGDAQFDILFRMLEPHELAAAMGFTSTDRQYDFAGTKTEQIKQIGNAVAVSMMQNCVGAIMADAAPKQKSADPARIAAE